MKNEMCFVSGLALLVFVSVFAEESAPSNLVEEPNDDVFQYNVTSTPDGPVEKEPLKFGSDYLLSRREPVSYGWGAETHRALTALALAGALQPPSNQDKDQLLMVKELELRLALALAKQHQEPLSAGQLALHINALLATCKNPRDFYGLNLVSKLIHENDAPSSYSYALQSLALCNSQVRFDKPRYLNLIDYLKANDSEHGMPDSLAMVVMAMSCGLRNHPMPPLERYINRGIKSLKKSQKEDGSFGNVYSSGLVLQALLETGANDKGWNRSLAEDYILSQQGQSGAFVDFMGTYFVLPFLANRTLVSLANWTCNATQDLVPPSVHPEITEQSIEEISFTVFIRAPEILKYDVNLTGQRNLSFYEISIINKERISIEYKEYAFGHMIVGVDGLNQDPAKKKYWMIYFIDKDGKEILTKTGVDGIFPQDGEMYLLDLKTFK